MLRRSIWEIVPEDLHVEIENKLLPLKDKKALRYTVILKSYQSVG